MAYVTVAEFRAPLPERDLVRLTDLAGDSDTVDEAVIAQALQDASDEIDSYIGKVVSTPLADPPSHLKVICRDLALHRLYINVGHDMTPQATLRNAAIRYLERVAAGEVAIGGGPAPIATSPGIAMTEGAERQITRDSLRGF